MIFFALMQILFKYPQMCIWLRLQSLEKNATLKLKTQQAGASFECEGVAQQSVT